MTKKLRVAINGFGRIGRHILRGYLQGNHAQIDIVMLNDLSPIETAAHLLEFDSVHGRVKCAVSVDGDKIVVDKQAFIYTQQADINQLAWAEHNIDLVLECTGRFTSNEAARQHLAQGASRVLVSAPVSGADITVVRGVNHHNITAAHQIISNASCTTNCLAPLAKALMDSCGIASGFMTTVHSYTADQRLIDSAHNDLYRARSAALNMIPTSTGAARAVGLVLPELVGKLDGVAIRVPTADVSVVDLVFTPTTMMSAEEINQHIAKAADTTLQGILSYTDKPLVSSDFIGYPASSTVQLDQTRVMDGGLVRVLSWYDNEWAFALRMLDNSVGLAKFVS